MCKIKKFDTNGSEDGHTFVAVAATQGTHLPGTSASAPDTMVYLVCRRLESYKLGFSSLATEVLRLLGQLILLTHAHLRSLGAANC